MSTTYYKAVRPDGTDFQTRSIDYVAAIGKDPVTVPVTESPRCGTSAVLHAAIDPVTTLHGSGLDRWPCRLLEVDGEPVARRGRRRGFFSLRVIREIDAHLALGPHGEEIAAIIERAASLTPHEISALDATSAADRDTSSLIKERLMVNILGKSRETIWNAVASAIFNISRDIKDPKATRIIQDVVGNTVIALIVRDTIMVKNYDILTTPWRKTIGKIHPDDLDMMESEF